MHRLRTRVIYLHRHMPRRDAYLLTWAFGYLSFAIYWLVVGSVWGFLFALVGIFSGAAALMPIDQLKSAGFAVLTAVSMFHAINFFIAFPGLGVSLPVQMSLLWFVVSAIHLLVAGWPNASPKEIDADQEG